MCCCCDIKDEGVSESELICEDFGEVSYQPHFCYHDPPVSEGNILEFLEIMLYTEQEESDA